MIATVNKSDLRKATLIAKKKRALKSSPVAPRVIIKAIQAPSSKNDYIVVMSGTENHFIETEIDCGVIEGGRVSCDLMEFDEKVRDVEGDTVKIESSGEAVLVYGENEESAGQHIVGSVDGEDPLEPQSCFEDSVLDGDKRIEQLQWNIEAAYRMATSSNRNKDKPNLQAIHHEGFGKDAGIAATDGAGAFHSSLTLPISHPLSMPPETGKVISYAIKKEDPDNIRFHKNENDHYCWEIGDTSVYFNEVDGNFPSIDQVTPDYDLVRGIKVGNLLSMLKKLRKEELMSMQVLDNRVVFTRTGKQGQCQFERQFMAKHTYKKIKGMCKHLDDDETIDIKIVNDPHSPVMFDYYEDGWGLDVSTIIMPINKKSYESPVTKKVSKRGVPETNAKN